MRICEFDEPTTLPEPETPSVDVSKALIGQVITFKPEIVTDKYSKLQHILHLHSTVEGQAGHKSYRLETQDPIRIKILEKGHHENDRVFKVRFLTDPDRLVSRYSMVHQDFTPNSDGLPITYRLKDVPDVENYDKYTNDDFFKKFHRRRLMADHGLIGYVLIEEKEQPDLERVMPVGAMDDKQDPFVAYKSPEEDSENKLEQAIALYQANIGKPRKYIIRLIKDKIGMSQAGASSYYTKAMHAVEDDN